jgi:hypothetical protein
MQGLRPFVPAIGGTQDKPRPGLRRFILPVPSLSKGAAVREGPTERNAPDAAVSGDAAPRRAG